MTWPVRLVVACLIAAATASAAASAPAAGPVATAALAGVSVRAVHGPARPVWRGDPIPLTDTVANGAVARAPRSVTRYYLVRGRQRLLVAQRQVGALAAGQRSHGPARMRGRVRPRTGRYRLLACNANCVASPKPVVIRDPRPSPASAPSISGATVDGSVLTAHRGSWHGRGPFAYGWQWQRCSRSGCRDLAGATSATFQLSPAEVGARMRVRVRVSGRAGSAAAASRSSALVAPSAPANTTPPQTTGTALVGLTVSGTPGNWSGTPPLTYHYQWQRCDGIGAACSNIAGATDQSHPVVLGDAPALRLAVTVSGRGGTTTVYSAPLAAGQWKNPVFSSASAADPFVLDVGGAHNDYWQFNTGNQFPILHSSDLLHWTAAGTAFAKRPAWAVPTGGYRPWAPAVLQANGGFVMYYTSLSAQYGTTCVGVATSSTPGGPYTDLGPLTDPGAPAGAMPIGCGDPSGNGNIDPSPFVDGDGTGYLYVSTSAPAPTIAVIPLSADRLQATGPRTALFAGTPGGWESQALATPVVEGPFVLKHRNLYYLFYSGGNWRANYGMGFAIGSSPTGPFTKSTLNPIMAETPSVASPGGSDLPVTGPGGGTWIAYHGRDTLETNPRTLRLDRFSWQAQRGAPDLPAISGPLATPEADLP